MQNRRRWRGPRGNRCRLTQPPTRGASLQLPHGPARPEVGPGDSSGGATARAKGERRPREPTPAPRRPLATRLFSGTRAATPGLGLCARKTTFATGAWQGREGEGRGVWAGRGARERSRGQGVVRMRLAAAAVGRLSGDVAAWRGAGSASETSQPGRGRLGRAGWL